MNHRSIFPGLKYNVHSSLVETTKPLDKPPCTIKPILVKNQVQNTAKNEYKKLPIFLRGIVHEPLQ